MYDALIIGGGPAGVSAALTLKSRGKQVAIIAGAASDAPLWKAPVIENYPGLPGISGRDMLALFEKQAQDAEVDYLRGRALSILAMGSGFAVSVGADYQEAGAVILCTGVSQGKPYPGERELLGRGVSYCATCDGMLYRGMRVAVIGLCAEAPAEAEFLRSIGCEVMYFDKRLRYELEGEGKLAALVAEGERHELDGVFILRGAVSADTLLPELQLEEGRVVVDAAMRTSVPGVFAAGDCTGKPFQIAKAAGEGNIAALTAAAYLESGNK